MFSSIETKVRLLKIKKLLFFGQRFIEVLVYLQSVSHIFDVSKNVLAC